MSRTPDEEVIRDLVKTHVSICDNTHAEVDKMYKEANIVIDSLITMIDAEEAARRQARAAFHPPSRGPPRPPTGTGGKSKAMNKTTRDKLVVENITIIFTDVNNYWDRTTTAYSNLREFWGRGAAENPFGIINKTENLFHLI